MKLLNLLKPNPCKEIEGYFKAVVLPQLERFQPYAESMNWPAIIKEDDRIRPVADKRPYLANGKQFKPGKVYSTTYKGPSGDKSACYFIEDVGTVYGVERYKNLSNLYAYAVNKENVFLFVWK